VGRRRKKERVQGRKREKHRKKIRKSGADDRKSIDID
jgi:hypothetical protein